MKTLWWILLIIAFGLLAGMIVCAVYEEYQLVGIMMILFIFDAVLIRGVDGKIDTDIWFG